MKTATTATATPSIFDALFGGIDKTPMKETVSKNEVETAAFWQKMRAKKAAKAEAKAKAEAEAKAKAEAEAKAKAAKADAEVSSMTDIQIFESEDMSKEEKSSALEAKVKLYEVELKTASAAVSRFIKLDLEKAQKLLKKLSKSGGEVSENTVVTNCDRGFSDEELLELELARLDAIEERKSLQKLSSTEEAMETLASYDLGEEEEAGMEDEEVTTYDVTPLTLSLKEAILAMLPKEGETMYLFAKRVQVALFNDLIPSIGIHDLNKVNRVIAITRVSPSADSSSLPSKDFFDNAECHRRLVLFNQVLYAAKKEVSIAA